MKDKIIVIKNNISILILLIAIIFFIKSLIYKHNIKEIMYIKEPEIMVSKEIVAIETKKQPKRIMPEEIDGFNIIGKLEIPKINLDTYILEETNEDTLNKSVTKLCGPKINEEGNFCILGHNYNKKNMFGNLKKLKINDTIILTNVYGQKIEYVICDIYKVYPDEVECLNQETYGEREATLITCTTGAIKRLVIKANENYD